MILTGLFLWWPRNAKGLGGVLYPRLHAGGRTFWRDIHSVTGIYVSFFALFLLFTGLPWAKAWGGYLKAARRAGVGLTLKQDWTTSSSEVTATRLARTQSTAATGETMSGMRGMSGEKAANHWGKHKTTLSGPDAFVAIDRMVATVAPLDLAAPVLIQPPTRAGGDWTAKSDAQNRRLDVDLILDGKTGAILKRTGFASKAFLDRVIGSGIAAHEGALFGVANQVMALCTTIGLVLLSCSGLIMWWRRKPEGVLGAPVPVRRVRFSAALVSLMIALGIYFPFLGVSMILVGLTERFVLRRLAVTARWLGLNTLHPGTA